MKYEHYIAFIAGLLILAYVLDAVVNPLDIPLSTPYGYFNPTNLALYPFTTVSISLKALALVIAPLWVMSLIKIHPNSKGVITLILSGLLQLYAIQDIATGALVVTYEWSLAFTLTGMLLLIPAVFYFLAGFMKKVKTDITGEFEEVWEEFDEEEDSLKRLKD